MLTYEQVKRYFSYDPKTGIVTWTENVHNKSNSRPGDKAGGMMPIGYIGTAFRIGGEKKFAYMHRIAWMLTHKKWPEGQIDHINGNRADNRLENLRDVPLGTNRKNMKKPKNNTSGYMGIGWDKGRNKWNVKIGVNGKTVNIGRFKELDEAIAAREQAEIEYGFHKNHGRTGT